MKPELWTILISIVLFMIGFLITWYNCRVMQKREDYLRHNIGMGFGIVVMFVTLLFAASGGVLITKHFESTPVVKQFNT